MIDRFAAILAEDGLAKTEMDAGPPVNNRRMPERGRNLKDVRYQALVNLCGIRTAV